MTVTTGRKPFILGFILVVLLLGGAVPAFSQEILTSFALGFESTKSERNIGLDGMVFATNVLFVSTGGLTVSGGIEFVTEFYNRTHPEPVIGIGYVFYRGIYFGALLNVLARSYDSAYYGGSFGDGILAPTLVAGLDFGSFLLEARASYLHGFAWDISGFKLTLGVGLNAGGSE